MAARKKTPHITEFLKGIYNFENYDGFLIVGDPHLSSFKPGTRLDNNFLDTVIDKLNQAVQICLKRNLFMIILGDLFHDDKDHNPLMLTKLIKVFKQLDNPPLTIIGNHEKTEHSLTDDTFTAALREAGLLYTIEKNKYWGRFKFNNESVYIGGTPYGELIPEDITGLIDKSYTEILSYSLWLTHHDLAIGSSYPGCIMPKEIKGCDIVINGHDHSTKEPVILGKTIYFNPGNITRMSIDKKDHIPQVWIWTPDKKRELQPIPLTYKKDIFNLVGRQVETKENIISNKEKEIFQSKFVDLLNQQQTITSNDSNITNDASILKDNINTLAKALSANSFITDELIDLADECSKEIRLN